MNFYDLLGVSRNATKEEIKSAYKSLVKKYHPDVNKDVSTDIIKNLNEAKEILLDDERRREYDFTLDSLNNSKEFSKDKDETYYSKNEEYKKTYSEAYVTRWQFFVSYIKNSVDKPLKKIIKSLLVGFNYLLFVIIKLICYIFVYVCFIMQEFINFISGLFALLGLLSLFVLAGNNQSGYFSFIPLNIQNFCVFMFFSAILELIKFCVLNGSVNIFRLINNIYDKLLVAILVKI